MTDAARTGHAGRSLAGAPPASPAPEAAPGPLQDSVLNVAVAPVASGAEAAGSLAGLRVAVTRSADRAGAFAEALAAAGAEPVLVPVIDFEISDNESLGAALGRLAAGEYRWLVVSSITTVRALKQWCEAAGTSLDELIPAITSVATIGPTSVAVLAAEGIHASLAPTDLQSAAGLIELWPHAPGEGGRVLLPQSDLAEPTLVEGMQAKGWDTDVVTAYHTVEAPARDELRLTATLARSGKTTHTPANASYPLLTPAQAAREVQAGAIHAVVLASGSAARRVAATMAPLPDECLVVAIGQPTRDEAQRLGLRVAATATHPTPAGIVAALAAAHNTIHTK
ncbi:uroporphyrinogen-III synthase [Arthrobacter sp. HLT1-20]